MKKNVLAIVTGVGYGDPVREGPILDALKRYANIKVAGYGKSYDFFRNKFDVIKIHGYKLLGYNLRFQFFGFLFMNALLPIFWLIDTIRLLQDKFKPSIIITDFEPIGIFLSKLLRVPCVSIFAFDPLIEHKELNWLTKLQVYYIELLYKWSDNVIISSLIKRRKNVGKYSYIGPIVRRQPNELPSEGTLLEELRFKRKPIVISVGGSAFGINLVNEMLTFLEEVDEDFIIFGYPASFNRRNLRSYIFQEDFLKYLKISKGVITLAGYSTLAECVVFRKPMLIFPIENHVEQQANVFAVKDFAMLGDKTELKKSILNFIKDIAELKKKMPKVKSDGLETAKVIVGVMK